MMLKKILLGTLFVGLTAVLVIGAINRTMAKSEDTSQAAGHDQNQTHAESGIRTNRRDADHQDIGDQNRGGGGRAAANSGQYALYQEPIEEWITYEGSVTQVPAAGVELVVETDDGELVVGTGPQTLAELGLSVQPGDALELRGYWEEDEFKAAEILHVASGQTLALRDDWGRPVWSGSAQNGRGAQENGRPLGAGGGRQS